MNIHNEMFDNPTALYMVAANALADESTGKNNKDIIDFIIKNKSLQTINQLSGRVTTLGMAIMSKSYEFMQMLLEAGAKISAVTEGAISPLVQAVKNDDPKAVEILTKYWRNEYI